MHKALNTNKQSCNIEMSNRTAIYTIHEAKKNRWQKKIATRVFFLLFLKLISAIFYQILIFSPNDSPSKTMKNVFYLI